MRYSVPAPHSFEEIGKAVGVTGAGARRIFLRAMRKLRERPETKLLAEQLAAMEPRDDCFVLSFLRTAERLALDQQRPK
jgi:hypothetical protein